MTPEEEQQKKEVAAVAAKIYPGRSLESLSDDEKRTLFRAYRNAKDLGQDITSIGTRMQRDATKQVGPSGITVNNPWEAAIGGAMTGYGLGMQKKANRDQASGREIAADMKVRQDAIDAEQRRREEEERNKFLERILAGGKFA